MIWWIMVIYLTRRNLRENIQNIAEKSDLMVKSLQEGLEGIREVLISNNQDSTQSSIKILPSNEKSYLEK